MLSIRKQAGDYRMAVSSKGGTVSEFHWGDKEIFYPQQIVSGKLRGGNPVCCPYFGKLDEFPDLPFHGWFREEELNLEVQENNGAYNITCPLVLLKRDDCFKYAYATLNHILSVSGLFTSLSISEYFSLSPSPVNPGFHPYFPTLGEECQIVFGCETIVQIKKGEQGEFPARLFPYPPHGIIHIHNTNGIITMRLSGDFSPDSSVIIWSDRVEEYICVEPVFGKIGEYAELGKNGLSKKIELCVAFVFAPR